MATTEQTKVLIGDKIKSIEKCLGLYRQDIDKLTGSISRIDGQLEEINSKKENHDNLKKSHKAFSDTFNNNIEAFNNKFSELNGKIETLNKDVGVLSETLKRFERESKERDIKMESEYNARIDKLKEDFDKQIKEISNQLIF